MLSAFLLSSKWGESSCLLVLVQELWTVEEQRQQEDLEEGVEGCKCVLHLLSHHAPTGA